MMSTITYSLVFLVAWILSGALMNSEDQQDWREQAIAHHAAHYSVDAKGNVTWEWNQ